MNYSKNYRQRYELVEATISNGKKIYMVFEQPLFLNFTDTLFSTRQYKQVKTYKVLKNALGFIDRKINIGYKVMPYLKYKVLN